MHHAPRIRIRVGLDIKTKIRSKLMYKYKTQAPLFSHNIRAGNKYAKTPPSIHRGAKGAHRTKSGFYPLICLVVACAWGSWSCRGEK